MPLVAVGVPVSYTVNSLDVSAGVDILGWEIKNLVIFFKKPFCKQAYSKPIPIPKCVCPGKWTNLWVFSMWQKEFNGRTFAVQFLHLGVSLLLHPSLQQLVHTDMIFSLCFTCSCAILCIVYLYKKLIHFQWVNSHNIHSRLIFRPLYPLISSLTVPILFQ